MVRPGQQSAGALLTVSDCSGEDRGKPHGESLVAVARPVEPLEHPAGLCGLCRSARWAALLPGAETGKNLPVPVHPARLQGAPRHGLPSSLVPRSSVQAAPRPPGSLVAGAR